MCIQESLLSAGSGDVAPPVSSASTSKSTSTYKDWVTSSIKKSASGFALTKNLSKMKSMVYGEKPKVEPTSKCFIDTVKGMASVCQRLLLKKQIAE